MMISPRRTILGLWYGTVFVSVLATALISFVMLNDVGNHAFSWHPILMSVSFLICMTQGIHSYMLGFGSIYTGAGIGDDGSNNKSVASRNYHGVFMILALVTAIGGWASIFIAHSKGKGHTAKGDPILKQIHTWMGYIVLIGVFVQCIVGVAKYAFWFKKEQRFAKWHGKIGPMLWLLGCTNVFLGVFFWKSASYTLSIQIIVSIFVALTVAITILFFEIHPKELLHSGNLIIDDNDNTNNNNGNTAGSALRDLL